MGPILAAALPSIISGGSALIGQGINALSQHITNRQQLKYNQKSYDQQRRDNLSDFATQNKYNSPEQQTQRLKEAGLNPALIYGKGTVDNFGGTIKSAEQKSYSPIAPKIDTSQIGDSLNQMADLQLKKAQTDNLRSTIETSAEQRALLQAQALNTAKKTDYTVFQLMKDQLLLPGSLTVQQQNIRQTDAQTRTILDSNDRAAATNASNLNEAVERILTSREQRANTVVEREQIRQLIQNLKKDNKLKQLDLNLKEMGIQPGDNILFRTAGQYLKDILPTPKTATNWLKQQSAKFIGTGRF